MRGRALSAIAALSRFYLARRSRTECLCLTAMSSERAPVVLYDIERSAAASSPDIPHILHAKRLGTRRLPRLPWPRPLANALTCLAIAASALQANGVYCWATYGPVVASMRRLDGTQAQTIVVGCVAFPSRCRLAPLTQTAHSGIVGVYLMAAPLGSLTDRYGPRM